MRFLRSEIFWLLPFLFLAAATLSLLRPWPVIPPTAGGGRVIVDGNLREVEVPTAPKIVSGWWTSDFLQKTHAIDVLINADEPRKRPQPGESLLVRLYPRLAEDASLWNFPAKTESVVAHDTGYVYLGSGDHYKDFGLLSVNAGPPEFTDKDNVISTNTRVWNDLIGQREQADILMRRYIREWADLLQKLEPHTLEKRVRTLGLVSPSDDWTRCYGHADFDARLALEDPMGGYTTLGSENDTERILAINPELIILFVGDHEGFVHDPRWRGLDAVRARRVYENTMMNGYTFDIDHQPMAGRWLAELAYPERLAPQLRKRLRAHYRESYAYALSEAEIDAMLRVEGNRNAAKYKRFMKKERTQGE
jgi:ABC-type Fe3+-hydroxamate transport system substrate-binding protein